MDLRRRVIHLVATSAFAGTERYVATLAQAQHERGDEVTVVGGFDREMRSAMSPSIAHIDYRDAVTSLRLLRGLPSPDIVHTHLSLGDFLGCVAFLQSSSVRIVSTRHIAAPRGSSSLGRLARRLIHRRLDVQIAPSQFIADRVDGVCDVIHTGVPDAPMGPHDEKVVLLAQRLEPEKDTATALRVWAQSRLRSSGWQLHIAGSGSQEAELQRLARTLLSPDCYAFLGHASDIPERMARAAIVMCTAPAEPFGLTVVEAMACGTPVVATAAGGHLETLGRVDGAGLFAAGDIDGATDILARLAKDDQMRKEYGRRLRKHQQDHLSLASFVSRVDSVYTQVLVSSNRYDRRYHSNV